MSSSMRGLVQFIADLRNARARELEEKRINKELANIRQKFKDSNLNGYQKKKYVCKLLYIYILGYNIDFGHLEALNLIASNKFSEKQVGYLAVSLLLNENHPLINLVLNSIRKDLNDVNELHNCLALHAVANVGGKAMAETLNTDVHKLLISPVSKPEVKKKAALTLLRLYRKTSHAVQKEWAERIVNLLDDPDFGVVTAVASLVIVLTQDDPETYKIAYGRAVNRLHLIIIEKRCHPDYLYYRVANPWLQVKLFRLLQNLPPTDNADELASLLDVLQHTLDHFGQNVPNVQQSNAQNAVLLEAVNLAIHMEVNMALMDKIVSRLCEFISSRETNLRYLGLDTMSRLSEKTADMEPIRKYQSTILGSLRDRDISVRRKGLDLLYSMCNYQNAEVIVAELMSYLETADFAIREDMVIKIAILTERHAPDYKWYINTIMKLISVAGEYVSDEVWQRAVQIVMNNEDLQPYAAHTLLAYLKGPVYYDSLVNIGGYVLGEFGHLIADSPGCSPIEQFMALQDKFGSSPPATKALLLSTYIKFVNLFPEIKPQLLQVFVTYSRSLDSELQQRACEYLALARLPTDDLLRTVCDEMPPFPERASILLTRINERQRSGSLATDNGLKLEPPVKPLIEGF
ncbi:Clathrin/coatomer adaptor, adaptin-like protein [Limtongia smithiae]|uniref:Clathrin/coatomer adaptor, adaptin-like protein n=1 Tax=Limtongia smithiae TaxID=1125753 RepID=UPI0034CD02D2